MIVYKVCDHACSETSKDIVQAVKIQIQELPDGFLSSLGGRPLSLIFAHAAESPYGILVLAEEGNQVIGYVMGATDISAFYLDFLRRKTAMALRFFLPRLFSFQRIKKSIETLLYPAKRRSTGENVKAELLDLAVKREYQSQGIATELFRYLVKEFHRRGVRKFQIPTSEKLNKAHRFYEKMGAKLAGSIEVHHGEKTLLYLYQIEEKDL